MQLKPTKRGRDGQESRGISHLVFFEREETESVVHHIVLVKRLNRFS